MDEDLSSRVQWLEEQIAELRAEIKSLRMKLCNAQGKIISLEWAMEDQSK